MTSTNETLNQSVLISAEEFAKFQHNQESLKSSSTMITSVAVLGKPNTCLVSSSSKQVIDSGAIYHMIGICSIFSSFQSHLSTSIVTQPYGS